MKIEKIQHKGYVPNLNIIGQWQYFYSNKKGQISLIELPDYWKKGETLWEIFCIDGDLFDDIERFNSKEEAEKKIYKILGEKK